LEKKHNPIVFHKNKPDTNAHSPDHHDDNKKMAVRPKWWNTLGVESGFPPVLALCGQTTEMSPGCTYAPSNKPVDKIMAQNSNCANTITTMGGLDPLFLAEPGAEATGNLGEKLHQQNKQF
jgi:hypothetical protein